MAATETPRLPLVIRRMLVGGCLRTFPGLRPQNPESSSPSPSSIFGNESNERKIASTGSEQDQGSWSCTRLNRAQGSPRGLCDLLYRNGRHCTGVPHTNRVLALTLDAPRHRSPARASGLSAARLAAEQAACRKPVPRRSRSGTNRSSGEFERREHASSRMTLHIRVRNNGHCLPQMRRDAGS